MLCVLQVNMIQLLSPLLLLIVIAQTG